jgi:hypothetical protein
MSKLFRFRIWKSSQVTRAIREKKKKKGFWFPTTKDIQEQAAVPSLPYLCHTFIKIPKIYIQEICRLGYKRKKKKKKKAKNKSDPLLLTSIILGFARSILLRTIRRFLCSNASCSSAFADDNGI